MGDNRKWREKDIGEGDQNIEFNESGGRTDEGEMVGHHTGKKRAEHLISGTRGDRKGDNYAESDQELPKKKN